MDFTDAYNQCESVSEVRGLRAGVIFQFMRAVFAVPNHGTGVYQYILYGLWVKGWANGQI